MKAKIKDKVDILEGTTVIDGGVDLHNDSVNSRYVVRSWEELSVIGNIHD